MMKNTQRGFAGMPIILLVLILAVGAYIKLNPKILTPEPVPEVVVKEETTAALNQKIFLGGGVYVTPIKVVSDSRCAVDVTCIWAGEVTLKVKLEKGAEVKEADVKEGGSVSFAGANISLLAVTPANNTKKPITEKDYRFTFKISY